MPGACVFLYFDFHDWRLKMEWYLINDSTLLELKVWISIFIEVNPNVVWLKLKYWKWAVKVNHLGNVLQVVMDRKLAIETSPGSGVVDYYVAELFLISQILNLVTILS